MNKDQLDKLAQPLVNIYNNLEKEMLINMASKLASKKNLLKEDPEIWLMHQLQILGMLDKDNLNRIKTMAGLTSAQLNQLMIDAGLEGVSQNEEDIKKAVKNGAHLKVPPPISESPQIMKIMAAYGMQAANVLNLVNQTMLINSKQMYTDILNKVVLDVTSGFKTHDQALREAVTMWAEKGLPALVDKAGRKWGVEGYVRTVIISSVNNNVNAIQDQRLSEWGIDLIEISSHSGARPLCAPFQGRIFSLSGTHKKYKPFSSTSFGKPAGLFGINCGHRKYPFIEGVNKQTYRPYPKEENDKVYKESQIQRAHERGIRKAKTQYEMHKAAGDSQGMEEVSKLIRKRQQGIRDFIDETGRTRRNYREQIHTNKDPKPLPTTVNPDPGIPKPKKVTKTIIDTPKDVMKPVKPDPVNIPPVNTDKVEDYKVVHKEAHGQHPDGTIWSKTTVYAVKGKGKNTEETLLGELSQNAVVKTNKKGTSSYNTSDGYIATDKDGNTIGVYKTQKAAKQYMLDKHLAEKGLIQKAKEPMKVTQTPKVTPDPIINPDPVAPKEKKLKLTDDVTVEHKGKVITGKVMDINKKTGDIEIMTPDYQFITIPKGSIKGLTSDLNKTTPDPKPITKPKPVTAKKVKDPDPVPSPNLQPIDPSKFKPIGKDHKDVLRDAETLANMKQSDVGYVRYYTSNAYTDMNKFLRTGRTVNNDRAEKAVVELQRVLRDNAKGLSQDTLLFRRIGQESIKYIFNDQIADALLKSAYSKESLEEAKKMLIGGALEDKAFMSTTHIEGSFGGSRDINIHILCPKGYKGGMFVDSVSAYRGENEYILNSGKKLNIHDIVIKDGKIFINVVPDDV